MKNYNKIVVIIMAIFCLSCSDSFLDVQPQQAVSDDDAIQNLGDLNSSITGVYNILADSDYYGRYMFLIPDVMADDVKQNSQSNRIEDFAVHIVAASDNDARNLWRNMYRGINAINNIINSDVILTGPQDEKNHIIGEAHALRGLIYFDLVRLYAQHYTFTPDASHLGVPIIVDFDPLRNPIRNSVKEVYDQAISDMETAIDLMKSNSRSGNSNTLSSTSVKALLSRVYLYKEDWPNAEAMASEVIGSSEYSLVPNSNYFNLWTTDNNSESIFEISMTESDNRGGNSIAGLYLPQLFGDYLPSNDVVSLYEVGDARLQTLKEDPFLSGIFAPFRIDKYPDVNAQNNTKVIRLAELYLIRAEARAEIGTNISGAQDDIDMVRQRALPSAPDNNLTGQALQDAIFLERRLELAFEGQRLWDLMRNKMDVVRTQCTSNICLIPYGSDTLILPIPQNEIDANPNAVQNPGY